MFDTREQAMPLAAEALETAPPRPRPIRSPNARRRSALVTGAALGAFWLVLTGFEPTALAFGAPAVLAGAALAFLFPPATPWRIAPLAALNFAAFFAWQSVRGALDVARRALDPRLPLAPGFRTVILTIGRGPGRVLLANTISLLPGTLSAEIEGRRLIVHTLDLDGDLAAEVAALEARIRAVFGARP
jgi:multicomponent Na+:H+ antiporter subunit E